MKDKTTQQVRKAPNPTGKGGFADHPENRNPGGWDKNESYQYWLNFFKHQTVEEFKTYRSKHPEMTMAALGAYARIEKTVNHLEEFREVANRTEGMPKQTTDITTNGKELPTIQVIIEDYGAKNIVSAKTETGVRNKS